MIRDFTLSLPLKVTLPLTIALLVLGSVTAVILLFHSQAEDAVLTAAADTLAQSHDRVAAQLTPAPTPDEPAARRLTRILETAMPGGSDGITVILDLQRRIVAAYRPADAARRSRTDGQSLAAGAIGWMEGQPVLTRRTVARARLDGIEVLLVATPLRRAGRAPWFLLSAVPTGDLLAEVHRQRLHGILLAGVIVLAATLLGFALARRVSRPVEKLTAYMRRIGRGNLDEDILLTESPEFMRLSFAVNRMVEGLRERLELRRSLAMAKEVQRRLLPADVPDVAGLDIAGRSYYCDETGGDYYDYLTINGLPPDTAVIALGDVSGHGIAAAMVMASARGILRSRCHDARSLGELLRHMNEQIVEDSGGGRYMTMLLVTANAARGELRWASAGHRAPLVLDPDSGAFLELEGGDVPLGVLAGVDYQEFQFTGLRPGHLVLLATDGLWETQNSAGEHLGLGRLGAAMTQQTDHDANGICGAIAAAALEFSGSMDQADDISFVVIKVR